VTPRKIGFVIAITSSLALSACTTNSGSAPASATGTPTQFSIRQVYESSDTELTGTDIKGAPQLSSEPATGSPVPSSADTPPSTADLAAYAALDCSTPANQKAGARTDDPTKFLVTCGNPDGSPAYFKYLLRPSVVRGSDILAASAVLDVQTSTDWTLQLTFKPSATNTWAKYTASHVGAAVAISVDSNVLSVELLQSEIVGPTQIDGTFTKSTASALAKQLSSNVQ
jgi:preprotein translocase subunit SecD